MSNHLLLVHGAWHNGNGFAMLRQELQQLGVTTSVVELSSVGEENAPLGDMYGDAAIVRSAVDELGGDCFVLAHSYGGLPVTEGLAGASNVKGLFFLTAFMLDRGESLFQACGEQDPPWWVRSSDDSRLTAATPVEVFYNTCESSVANEAAAQLRSQSLTSFLQPITKCAWGEIDSTYIVCTEDQAIPVQAQQAMAQRANQTVTLETDHSPFLSDPKSLARILAERISQVDAR